MPDGTVPVVAIVGRPNVGKSTLFNRLTRSRQALVADEPGLTRDRQYGRARVGARPWIVVDTGGLTESEEGLDPLVTRQALQAVEEADLVLLLVDGRAGLTAGDETTVERLRRYGKPVLLVVNKTEGLDPQIAVADFHRLGLGAPQAVSAAHGHGTADLVEAVESALPSTEGQTPAASETAGVRVAVVGRPNVGKSTLVNRMVGGERVLTFDAPGTTRDSVEVPFSRDGRPYVLIDTAGVRRRARVDDRIEKFSVVKTLQAIEAADVVVLLLDARGGVAEQDLHLIGHVLEAGRALVLAVNKWDGLAPDERARVKSELDRRLAFLDFARPHFISALHGSGVGDLFAAVDRAAAAAARKMPTPLLTRLLQDAVAAHAPPLVRGRRIKLRYAHQGGQHPPVVVIHGNQADQLPESYRRYLTRRFREALDLEGTPVRIELRTGANPFAGRRNELSPRQARHRQRMIRHAKKG
ncbi:MAG: ribosome biogenesis GTPase Der [Gammaproteobacteria bacterium]|jgi:GTP-binding protein|nr:ribosome biogenesis GTPase Der [Gammaproteobacteria bacterium]